jgi:hypothetical protein
LQLEKRFRGKNKIEIKEGKINKGFKLLEKTIRYREEYQAFQPGTQAH